MREWDEITRDILIKRDEKIARKKAKMRVVKRTALSAFCFCLVSTAGIGIWKNIPQRSKPVDDSSIQQMILPLHASLEGYRMILPFIASLNSSDKRRHKIRTNPR